jgi:nicotinamidase/pyrazinamidase
MPSTIVFWDVDTQVDFIDPGGKLSVPGASEIRSRLKAVTSLGSGLGCVMSGSVDAHTPWDLEFRHWPEHCVYGTPGQRKIPETTILEPLFLPSRRLTVSQLRDVASFRGQRIFEKQDNDARTNPNVAGFLQLLNPSLVVYGVVTEVCVDKAVKYLADELGYPTVVVTDAVAAIDRRRAGSCIDEWRRGGVGLVSSTSLKKYVQDELSAVR